jgi:hypothetical protein
LISRGEKFITTNLEKKHAAPGEFRKHSDLLINSLPSFSGSRGASRIPYLVTNCPVTPFRNLPQFEVSSACARARAESGERMRTERRGYFKKEQKIIFFVKAQKERKERNECKRNSERGRTGHGHHEN